MIDKIVVLFILCFSFLELSGAEAQLAWKTRLGGEFSGSPAVSGGKVIVAGKDGTLRALDGSGKQAWQQKLPAGSMAPAAVAANGDIYVACIDGSLLRFAAAGREIWRVKLGQPVRSTPLLAAGALFVAGEEGRLFKVRERDGMVLKQAELKLPVFSSPVWDADRKNLLVPTKDFHLIALSRELQVLWKFRTAGVNYSVPAVDPKNEIYFSSMDHHLYKLTAGGRLLWKFKAKGWLKGSPVVDDRGRAYFGSYGRFFYAVDADGRQLWQFQGKAAFTSGAALDAAGNVYCGDTSGTVYALDRNGKLLWQYKYEDFITADMTILPEKVLLAGSIDGTLLAFRIGQPLSQKAWWAKALGNLSNSGFDEE